MVRAKTSLQAGIKAWAELKTLGKVRVWAKARSLSSKYSQTRRLSVLNSLHNITRAIVSMMSSHLIGSINWL